MNAMDVNTGDGPRYVYRGTYRFSIELTGVGRVYFGYNDGVTRDANAAIFALYDVEGANPPAAALQPVGDVAAARFQHGPVWFLPQDMGDPPVNDKYPRVVWLGGSRHAALQCTFVGGRVQLRMPYYKALLSANNMFGLKLWAIGENSLFAPSAWWTVETFNEWSANQANADLRDVQFVDLRTYMGQVLDGAKLNRANLVGALVLSGKARKTDFSNAGLQKASFTWASVQPGPSLPQTDLSDSIFNGAGLLSARFDGCNLTRADFTNATFAFVMSDYFPPAAFPGANLTSAKFSSGTDLTGVNFSEGILRDTKMSGTKLVGAKFMKADLTGADLSNADLSGADFTDATLLRTNLSGATFDAATKFLGASMMGADFTGCNLSAAQFSHAPKFYQGTLSPPTPQNPRTRLCRTTVPLSLLGLDWTWLDLTGATISAALATDLTGFKANYAIFPVDYNLQDRKLDDASFYYAIMPGVYLQKASVLLPESEAPDFSHADLTGARMSGVRLKKAKFVEARLTGATLANSVLDEADFSGAHLETVNGRTADLSYCSLRDATFENAHLSGANLTYVRLWGDGAKVTGATVERTSFDNAYLANLDFQNVAQQKLVESSFAGACLVNAKFQGTALTAVVLTGACLQGAKFANATLTGARMANAAIWTRDEKGSLTITGATLPNRIEYDKTDIATSATSGTTTCPDGDVGPCSGTKWNGRNAPMTQWTWGSKMMSPDDGSS